MRFRLEGSDLETHEEMISQKNVPQSVAGKPRRTLQTVERAVALLRCFTNECPDLTIGDLIVRLGLSKPTVYRLLVTMEQLGFVERDSVSQHYRPGLGVVSLASIALNNMTIRRLAMPAFYYFANRLHLGSAVAIMEGHEVFYLAHSPHPKVVDLVFQVGQRHPLHATALGRALLSGLTSARAEALLRETELRSCTPYTITDFKEVVREVCKSRDRGYALADQELCLRWCSIAAPIRDRRSCVVAALGVSLPDSDIRSGTIEQIAKQVVEAADRVSYKLGYPLAGSQEQWTELG